MWQGQFFCLIILFRKRIWIRCLELIISVPQGLIYHFKSLIPLYYPFCTITCHSLMSPLFPSAPLSVPYFNFLRSPPLILPESCMRPPLVPVYFFTACNLSVFRSNCNKSPTLGSSLLLKFSLFRGREWEAYMGITR